MSGLPALARIAWRDVLRNRRRSLLIVALIAIPVAGIVGGVTVFRTTDPTPHERATSEMGVAEALVRTSDPDTTVAELRERLPDGTVIETATSMMRSVAVPGSEVRVVERRLDLDGLAAGMLDVIDGRAPSTPTEVAVDAATLTDAERRIGGALRVDGEDRDIVGVVRDPEQLDGRLLLGAPTAAEQVGPGDGWLVSLPPGATEPIQMALDGPDVDLGVTVTERELASQRSANQTSGIVVLGGLALVEASIIAAAAFAVSTRRRQRELGLLAATGAHGGHLRRAVLLSAGALGLLGSLVGTALGLGAGVAMLPLLPTWSNRAIDGLAVAPGAMLVAILLGVVSAVLAAVVPARAASRVPVLLALSGRRPPTTASRSGLVRGAVLTVLGLGSVLLSVPVVETVSGGAEAGSVIVLGGSVAGVLGFGMMSPWILERVGRAAPHLPVGGRIAVRDAARFRGRNGPVVTAVLAGLSLAVALSTGLASLDAEERARYQPFLSDDQLQVTGSEAASVARQLGHELDAIAVAPVAPLRVPGTGRAPSDLVPADPDATYAVFTAVGDEQLVRALGGDGTAAAALDRGEVVIFGESGRDVTEVVPMVEGEFEDERRDDVRIPVHHVEVAHPAGLPNQVVSPATLAGLDEGVRTTTDVPWLVRLPRDVTDVDAERATEIAASSNATVVREEGYTSGRTRLGRVVLALAILTAMVVVAIALALAAAESRDDQRTLRSVGADPGIHRSVAAGRAAVLAGLGGLLAVPAGMLPAWGLIRAVDMTLVVPWPTLAAVALGAPSLAVAAAWLFTRPSPGWTATA